MRVSLGGRGNRCTLFAMALLLVLGGAMYRFDVYLIAYLPVSGTSYFPSLAEILMSVALVATGVAVYVVMAKMFPVLSGVLERRASREPPDAKDGVVKTSEVQA